MGAIQPDGFIAGSLFRQDGSTYGAFAARIFEDGSIVAAANVNGVISQIQGFRFF
jgi:hypothetical protein